MGKASSVPFFSPRPAPLCLGEGWLTRWDQSGAADHFQVGAAADAWQKGWLRGTPEPPHRAF